MKIMIINKIGKMSRAKMSKCGAFVDKGYCEICKEWVPSLEKHNKKRHQEKQKS